MSGGGGITGLFVRLGSIFNSPVNVSLSTGGEPAAQRSHIEPGDHHPVIDGHAVHDDHHHAAEPEENPNAPFLTHDDAHDHHYEDDDHHHHHDDVDDHHHH